MRIDSANKFHHLPFNLVEKIKESLSTYWRLDHTIIQNNNFIDQLPIKIRKELLNNLFEGFMNRFYIFFKSLEEGFNHEIVTNLFPRKYKKGDEIIKIDTETKFLCFLHSGEVQIH